jgi:hypothetical protein
MQRKQFLRCLGVALGSASVGSLLSACGGGGTSAPGAAAPDPVTDLSTEEVAGLLFMREEEKLAHDVYVALFGLWGAQVFTNIADSETQHTEAVRQLILSHGLEDPAATTPPGVFVNDDLQALYNQLVAQGTPSLIEALKVGCLIEEKDIQDIELKKAEVADEPDIVQVYDNLLCGSRNHLRAFSRTLTNQGGSYTPVFLSQAQWDAIAGSEQESCGG